MNKKWIKKILKVKSISLKLGFLISYLRNGLLAMKRQLEQDALFAIKL